MSRECHKAFTSLPIFYKQLTEFWELTSIGNCDEPSFILNQSVWNNKHITKSGSPLFDTILSDEGINYTKVIFNTITCDFKLWNEVKNKFRVLESMIFRWYSIILSIPRDWKTIMKMNTLNTGDNNTCIVFKDQLMLIDTIRTKAFYDLLISKIFKQPSSQKTIARKLIWRYLQSVSWSLAEFRHNKIVQSPHDNYFNVCRQHKEK